MEKKIINVIRIGPFVIENFVSLGVSQISDSQSDQAKINAQAFADSLKDL